MTVTTNTIGSNSAEIIAYNETNLYTGVMTAVDTFVTNHGWTAKSGVGNSLEKVYTSANAAGSGTKEIKINAIDLHIEHADSFTGTTTVTATNRANRVPRMDHVTYPDYVYAQVSSESIASIRTNVLSLDQGQSTNADSGDYTFTSYTFNIASGQTYPLYPGQWIRLVDSTDTTYYYTCQVGSYDNTTGSLSINTVISNRTDSSPAFTTNWYVLVDRLNYVDDTEPAHIFISATSKHIAIQCRNTTGVWHDFHAVIECENPLAVEDASILTTGYMLGNSGYTRNWKAHHNWDTDDTDTYSIDDIGHYGGNNGQSSANGNISPALKQELLGKSYLWTGPFSMPSTRKGRTSFQASVWNSINTPLGQAKTLGHSVRLGYVFSNISIQSADNSAGIDLEREVRTYFRGMGDVIPATVEPVTGDHWALTGIAVTDLGRIDNSSTAFGLDLLTTIDDGIGRNQPFLSQFHGANSSSQSRTTISITPANSSEYRSYNTTDFRQKSSWKTTYPTLLGRIYNVKFVTTGLHPSSILSVKVDANGFADTGGAATDHLVFAVRSTYTSNVQYNGTPPAGYLNDEDTAAQQRIRQSESVAIGFPV